MLEPFLSRQLARGRLTFTREEALRVLPPGALTAALSQLIRKGHLHGATAEAPAFQLIVPKLLRDFAAGRHELEFINQTQSASARTNRSGWLAEMKTDSGVARPPRSVWSNTAGACASPAVRR